MIPNITQNLQSLINSSIERYLGDLAKSYPCKVLSYSEGLVEVETLLVKGKNDVPIKIPTIQSPYFTLPIQEGDIGLALNCSFLFAPILENKEIETNILSTQKNGLFFLPLLQKDKQYEAGDITFKSAPELKSSLIINDESVNLVVAENTKCTIDGSTMSFNINNKSVIDLSESELGLKINSKEVLSLTDSELGLKLGGKDALTVGSSNISTPLGIEQSTPIALKGSGGSLKDYNDLVIQLMDALAMGMKGTATAPAEYQSLKASLLPQLQGMFK